MLGVLLLVKKVGITTLASSQLKMLAYNRYTLNTTVYLIEPNSVCIIRKQYCGYSDIRVARLEKRASSSLDIHSYPSMWLKYKREASSSHICYVLINPEYTFTNYLLYQA